MAGRSIDANSLPWSPSRSFPGAQVKHLETRSSHPGLSFHVVKIEAGAEMTEHVHEQSIETLYVISGRCILNVDKQQFGGGAGFCATVPARAPHSVKNAGDTPLELVMVYSPPLV